MAMGPSDRAFNQVKSILGKLDRSIDQLREQRVARPSPAPAAPTPNAAAMSQQIGGRAPEQPPAARPNSPFGRATPLPPRS